MTKLIDKNKSTSVKSMALIYQSLYMSLDHYVTYLPMADERLFLLSPLCKTISKNQSPPKLFVVPILFQCFAVYSMTDRLEEVMKLWVWTPFSDSPPYLSSIAYVGSTIFCEPT
jgi:hypothetical protein